MYVDGHSAECFKGIFACVSIIATANFHKLQQKACYGFAHRSKERSM